MKMKLTYWIFLVMIFAVKATTVAAQDSTSVKSLPLVTVTSTTKKIPDRVWKGFSSYFNYPENPMWYRLNKNYLAKFGICKQEVR